VVRQPRRLVSGIACDDEQRIERIVAPTMIAPDVAGCDTRGAERARQLDRTAPVTGLLPLFA
jgi:hypothetical protein